MIPRLFRAPIALALTALALTGLAGPTAQATILETYTNSVDFLADNPVPAADTITFGPTGPGALIDLTGAAASASAGLVSIAAETGNVFGASTILSTDIENTTLVLTFSAPLTAVGMSTLITDAFFDALGGVLTVEAVGSGSEDLAVTDAGASFFGLRSDVPFSTVRISVDSFDQDASAVAFASLTETIYPASSRSVDVPAPGAVALLLPLAALALLRRRATA